MPRGITPPPFIAWALGIWTMVGAVVLVGTPWPILLLATILLLVGARRAARHDNPAPTPTRHNTDSWSPT